jgi:hypothetical protein
MDRPKGAHLLCDQPGRCINHASIMRRAMSQIGAGATALGHGRVSKIAVPSRGRGDWPSTGGRCRTHQLGSSWHVGKDGAFVDRAARMTDDDQDPALSPAVKLEAGRTGVYTRGSLPPAHSLHDPPCLWPSGTRSQSATNLPESRNARGERDRLQRPSASQPTAGNFAAPPSPPPPLGPAHARRAAAGEGVEARGRRSGAARLVLLGQTSSDVQHDVVGRDPRPG